MWMPRTNAMNWRSISKREQVLQPGLGPSESRSMIAATATWRPKGAPSISTEPRQA